MSLAAEHTEWGDIQISDQALAAIVGIATREFSDIVGMESTLIHVRKRSEYTGSID